MVGRLLEDAFLVGDAGVVEEFLLFQDLLLARLKNCIEAPKHGHWQNDVAVFAADVEVSEYVVGDGPEKIGNGG